MKKSSSIVPLLAIALMCGCGGSDGGVSQTSESSAVQSSETSAPQSAEAASRQSAEAESERTISFSQSDLEIMAINADKSNYQNSINIKSEFPFPGKACYVEETDTMFYSDAEALYQKTGDTVIKLLDSPAYSINVAEGYLYYIVPEDKEGFSWYYGGVYRMSLADGQTERILDKANALSVYPDGFFYMLVIPEEIDDNSCTVIYQYMRCDFDGSNIEQRDDFCFITDNYFSYTHDGQNVKAVNLKDGTSEIITEDESASYISLYNNKIYYVRYNYETYMNKIVEVDMETKESKTYTTHPETYFEDYGFSGGELYLYDLATFYRARDMKQFYIQGAMQYEALCTCGDKLYGVHSDGSISELVFEDTNGVGVVTEADMG